MSLSAFQAAVIVNSASETVYGSGNWTLDLSIRDYEGVHTAMDTSVGDVVILDTSATDIGTLSRYLITSITSKTPFGAIVQVQYESSNNAPSPDISGYDTNEPGLITRKTVNYSLLNLPSLSIQGLSDKFAFYLINYMSISIVDNIVGGTGGGNSVKPDWTALSTDPAGILNKPILGTASPLDVPASGDAATTQVVLGSDTRLASQVLTNPTPTPTTIGGIVAGTTFNSLPVETVLQNLLYPYQVPAFTSFGISGQATPLEVGASVVGGVRSFAWTTSNSTNIGANTISIIDVTNSNAILTSNAANTGSASLTLTAVTKIIATTHQWKIQATNTQSNTLSSTYTVTWQWRRFYGESVNVTLTALDVQALRISALSSTFAGTYPFSAGGYKYIAYPTTFGTATSFKDQSTNLDVPFQPIQIISITNANGIATNYNVHRTTNILGSAINIVVA
jgi:hypothetical protein